MVSKKKFDPKEHILYDSIKIKKQANSSMQFAVKMVVTFWEKEKDSDWERAQRKLASGNFYFLTSIVVANICLLCHNSSTHHL